MRKAQIRYYNSYEAADKDMFNEDLSRPGKEKVAAVNEIRRKIFRLKGLAADNIVKKVISFDKR
ncbi:MAG TPA: hypothetical protein DEE98_08515 [Elusimicrobia bacterium]|nr:MAG: hypothetical protein A2278_05105 [Elusimicrobia bacterium RIFOXYA12_FULL_49_49]OGS09270.1 MAG: hypothetical protein A2386_02450 [Elusimicrobia bacterium RIFOXYB1_FULL_48_9]OGS09291.1 MAG: hypothetical protein A2204_05225 [Elusimicrobia bacterium RIFOXYA1_FULL_47_7]OGS15209.1 MAG: hypothetical protein A2251_06835 [Elusimicrobia bacterium RIFOXYA2_FULL_47_53]OGS25936.1 MAG: hypothetical protein A2339_00970 [Elusimicrobia bacterium RIFOXYB12_FULL_50_12]OGS30260.1 MAG: hypothetical protein